LEIEIIKKFIFLLLEIISLVQGLAGEHQQEILQLAKDEAQANEGMIMMTTM